MKKIIKDPKALLLENMIKLNPDFKLTEGDDKWIQKAVDPEHKGYCTPMTKPTCTPARKALAKRFKKGIENESYGVADPLGTNMAKPVNINEITERGREVIYEFKTDAITETMGSRDGKQYRHPVYLIEGNPKYAPIYNGVVLSISDTPGSWYVDTLMEGNARHSNIMYIDFGAKWICSNWSEIMKELNEWISNNETIQNEGVNLGNFGNPEEFKVKVDKIKAQVDKLFNEEDFDVIDTLYRLMVEKKKTSPVLNTNPNQVNEDHSPEYQRKAELIKGKIDFLFDNNHYDILDKVDNIISQVFPENEPEMELAEAIKYMKHLIK
jgi:hypothetical protein